jgi:hypothetical protein
MLLTPIFLFFWPYKASEGVSISGFTVYEFSRFGIIYLFLIVWTCYNFDKILKIEAVLERQNKAGKRRRPEIHISRRRLERTFI